MSEQKTFRISEEKRRILLVEDDFINQQMLLESLGGVYDVVMTETGEDALEIIRNQHETLSMVLLDLNLPGIQGTEVLSRIKGNPVYAHLPVIVMTSDSEAEVECLTLGAIDFIPKPYPASKVILARILRTVELSEDRETLRLTERDQLTGLYNKEFFYRYASQLDLYHKDTPTDAIVLDINHFHTINDRYGKAKGNEILKLIAEQALAFVSENGGMVCRCEADTFMFYCPHFTDYKRLLDCMSVSLDDRESGDSRIRLRMGVYAEADRTIDIEQRFDRAKMAADTVRGNLTNPIGFFDDSMRDAENRAEQLIDDFPAAIREKQFRVYFQPKFNVTKDVPFLCSAEALIRWNHPEIGLIHPDEFIPLLEGNGHIREVDEYVWNEAAGQIVRWREQYGVTLPVSVNLSRIDVFDPALELTLERIMTFHNLTRDLLKLEVTETAYTENAGQVIRVVESLREKGYVVELDDFGTGYSSLNMLTAMPLDYLKMDRTFVRNMEHSERDARLVEMILGTAKGMNVPVIAEGVETGQQLRMLRERGCEIVQGYYFSRPLPAADFEAEFLAESRPAQ